MMNTVQSSIYFWFALIGFLAFLAVLPTLIALFRGVDDLTIIMLFNAICCTTVIGWPVALILAIKWPRPNAQPTPTRRTTRHHTNYRHGQARVPEQTAEEPTHM